MNDNHQELRLEARAIGVERGGRRILDTVDFQVAAGQALIVTGPNGAGKSTLLRALAGLLPLCAGALVFTPGTTLIEASRDFAEMTPGECAHFVGHADGLKSSLTAFENLEFWAHMLALLGADEGLSPRAALDLFGLGAKGDFPVGYLSAGQKRRVALARLFVAPRPLWILDEPATALDAASQARLAELMARHRAGGGAIVAATHAPLGLADANELRLGQTNEAKAGAGP